MSGRRGKVYYREHLAGSLEETVSGYRFTYDPAYIADSGKPDISLTLPKQQESFETPVLFPFFYGLLAEGVQKDTQCRFLKIDEADDFGRLLRTASQDTIGAVTVHEEVAG
ncbi:MAG: HipA N-terminal domain-containing protein [bacterium]